MLRKAAYFVLNSLRGRGLARLPGTGLVIRAMRRRSVTFKGHTIELDPEDSMRLSVFGSYEPEQTALVESVVRPGDVVVDVGAHIGYYTLLFSKLVGEKGKVFAFEPAPETFAILERNIERNNIRNVVLVNAGVGARSESGKLHLGANRLDYHVNAADAAEPGVRSVAIDIVALDDYFAERQDVSFIKMDIQGAEPAATAGMERLLERCPRACLFTEFWPDGIRRAGGDPDAYRARLLALGFTFSRQMPGTDGSEYLYCTKPV